MVSGVPLRLDALKPELAGDICVVGVGAALALRLALTPWIAGAQFITFFPAVILVTLLCGTWPGLVAVGLSVLAATQVLLDGEVSFAQANAVALYRVNRHRREHLQAAPTLRRVVQLANASGGQDGSDDRMHLLIVVDNQEPQGGKTRHHAEFAVVVSATPRPRHMTTSFDSRGL